MSQMVRVQGEVSSWVAFFSSRTLPHDLCLVFIYLVVCRLAYVSCGCGCGQFLLRVCYASRMPS